MFTALAACSSSPTVEGTRASTPNHPVIIIPGLQGSRLVSAESDRVVWGARLDLLLGSPILSELALSVTSLDFAANRDDLVPAGIIEDAVVMDFYAELIAALESAGGYTCASPAAIEPSTDCALFAWDWRRDLVEAAAELDRTVERLRDARFDPDLQVDIVAHSAGALVARYFVRYGGADVLDAPLPASPPLTGASSVRNALLIAPPNYGSIYGLQRAMRGVSVGLSQIAPELTATMPSVYQLLPHPDRQWMIDLEGDPVSIDLYDIETWRTFRDGIFRRVLTDLPSPPTPHWSGFSRMHSAGRAIPARAVDARDGPFDALRAAGASCRATPAVCLLGFEDGRLTIRLTYQEAENLLPGVDYRALMLEPGDGRVTVSSLTGRLSDDRAEDAPFPFDVVYFACEDHATLPSHSGLIAAMLSVIGS